MKIQEGKVYRRRDGQIAGPVKLNFSGATCWAAGYHFDADGRHAYGDNNLDLIEEVTVTPVLDFALEAGKKYCTVKLDGSDGPVVEPSLSLNGKAWRRYAPFYLDGGLLYVLTTGDCVNMLTGETHYRITAPYIEPKPPTLTERLEHYAELDRGDMRREQLLAGIIADVKALEATK